MDELDQAANAEGDMLYNRLAELSLVKRIVDDVIQRKSAAGKPWIGALPKPRKSPPMTLGAAMANAKVISSPRVFSS